MAAPGLMVVVCNLQAIVQRSVSSSQEGSGGSLLLDNTVANAQLGVCPSQDGSGPTSRPDVVRAQVGYLPRQKGHGEILIEVQGVASGVVATPLAEVLVPDATTASQEAMFTFKVSKTSNKLPHVAVNGEGKFNMQATRAKWRRLNKDQEKEGLNRNMLVGEGRDKVIGNKRGAQHEVRPTGSDFVFSFENVSAGSDVLLLYDDVNVSCNRVCIGRVKVVAGVDGMTAHLSKGGGGEGGGIC